MVLEKQILPFFEWLLPDLAKNMPGALVLFLGLGVLVTLFALMVGFLISAVRGGPGAAIRQVRSIIGEGWRDLRDFRMRRVFAMARLAFKESIRRYVLVVFAVLALIFLFAGWFLDVESDNPTRLYISFAIRTVNLLVLLLTVFLSAFSLPADIEKKTIFTVVTKPVRAWEIILGRILGFSAIGTMILGLMCLVSLIFVVRGLNHEHPAVEQVQLTEAEDGHVGRTSFNSHHRHDFNTANGVRSDSAMGHYHVILHEGDKENPQIRVGPPRGALQARVPIYGDLEFLGRDGKPKDKGINVGKEWTYRGYIEGSTLSAGIYHFKNLDPRDFLKNDEVPLEMSIRVFRTYTGEIERGIYGSLELRNPNPDLNDPEKRKSLDKDTAVKSVSMPFTAIEFTPESFPIPRQIEAIMLDGTTRKVDLFDALTHNGDLDIVIRCDERAQYFGLAKTDVYIRAADKQFWWNFVKSFITLWLQMVIVTAFGVMFSTFLTGSVALISTVAVIVMGFYAQSIADIATGKTLGGGPIEAMIRVITQDNLVTPLEVGWSTQVIKAFDAVAMQVIRSVSYLMPNFGAFSESGGVNTASFAAYGFDIPSSLMLQHICIMLAYVTLATCAGYFFLKTKEIAA